MTTIQMIIALGLITFVIVAIFINKKRRPPLNTLIFTEGWRKLQMHCRTRANWHIAVKEADALLDKALKKRKYKGKTMGTRLMAAQRDISNNDGIWAAHNLVKKMNENTNPDLIPKLNKKEVLDTLKSFQEALVDLGALRRGK
jgi:hypothetical protein